jgi:Ca-activated chloride channel family protein
MHDEVFAGALLTVALSMASANAQSRDRVIVLAASNSMWGQIDGEAKVTIARQALSGLIDALDTTDQIGLIAYGHHQGIECSRQFRQLVCAA